MAELSKAQKLAEAAKMRTKIEQEVNKELAADTTTVDSEQNDEIIDAKKEAAEVLVQGRPQAVNQSLTGELDIEAMGDVKGDGRDAKDYDDGDPDKALGVPVYEHGLSEHNPALDRAKERVTGSARISSRTQAEQARGAEALKGRRDASDKAERKASTTRTVVTDTDADPDGTDGKTKAELAAEAAKKKVADK